MVPAQHHTAAQALPSRCVTSAQVLRQLPPSPSQELDHSKRQGTSERSESRMVAEKRWEPHDLPEKYPTSRSERKTGWWFLAIFGFP